MTKTTGKRDAFLYLFLLAILGSIWLAMVQIDRQWVFIAATQEKLDNQTRDIADLRRQITRGGIAAIASNPNAAATDGDSVPATWAGFARAQAATQNADYAPGDWLVSSFAAQVASLTPYRSSDEYAARVQEWVFDSLVTRNPETLEWQPLVAESWETSANGLTTRFKLREGVVFSDGTPLTADDVKFSWEFLMDERIAAPRARAYYSRISDVSVDGNTVTFKLAEPYFLSFLAMGTLPIMPKHFYGKYLESVEAAEQYNNSTGLLLGSGPYRMESPTDWKPGDLIELVRNERYWGWVPPAFDRRIWKTITSDAAQLTEFKNGGIDLYGAQALEYRDLLANERVSERADTYEYYSPVRGYRFIGWNNQSADGASLFSDRRVREAMTYLTDRKRLVNEVFFGHALAINGPFNPFGPQANPELPIREYDPKKALALLAEAGYADRDGDGVLESAAGKPFSFKLSYPAASDAYKRIVLLLKDMYVRAGILMEPEPLDWPVLIDRVLSKSIDAVLIGWGGALEIDVYQTMHSSQTGAGGDNFTSYVSPELDRLIEAARIEMDPDKRMPLWHKVHTHLFENQPYTYLFKGQDLVFIDKRIKNVRIEKATGLNSGGRQAVPSEWYVPTAQQKYSR